MADENENLDVKPATDATAAAGTSTSSVEQTPTDPAAGLDKVIKDTFEASTKDDKVDDKVATAEADAKQEEKVEEKTKTDKAKVEQEDKGPVPYERFSEVNTAK